MARCKCRSAQSQRDAPFQTTRRRYSPPPSCSCPTQTAAQRKSSGPRRALMHRYINVISVSPFSPMSELPRTCGHCPSPRTRSCRRSQSQRPGGGGWCRCGCRAPARRRSSAAPASLAAAAGCRSRLAAIRGTHTLEGLSVRQASSLYRTAESQNSAAAHLRLQLHLRPPPDVDRARRSSETQSLWRN